MAENLRFNSDGSVLNSENPSSIYGLLYDGASAKEACPKGWHLPSDAEWSELEMELGMPESVASTTGWRGKHAGKMKSVVGWNDGGNGTNSTGLNVFPSGFFFPAGSGEGAFLDGLGSSAGFWSSDVNGKAWIRFLGAPLPGVNRFEETLSDGFAHSVRCVKD